MYKNSARAARITMVVATAPPCAVVNHVKTDEWHSIDWYMAGALHAV
jgi:hypothetical protein